jgi:8-oxo-dGTP diphosphatase
MSASERIVVVAAVIEQGDRYLVSRRLQGTHLAGFWEFPGGKIDPDERAEDALRREIREELDADITTLREIFRTTHAYPERTVELRFFRAVLTGPPKPAIGQELRWIRKEEFATLEFPPADAELIANLLHARV